MGSCCGSTGSDMLQAGKSERSQKRKAQTEVANQNFYFLRDLRHPQSQSVHMFSSWDTQLQLRNLRHSLSETHQVFGHLIAVAELDRNNLTPVFRRSQIPKNQFGKENKILSLMVCFLIPFPAKSRDPWCYRCVHEVVRYRWTEGTGGLWMHMHDDYIETKFVIRIQE